MQRKRKKYLVYPGWVISKNDCDTHYISAKDLINLYNVNPKDCIIIYNDTKVLGLNTSSFTKLRPRADGKYKKEQ